jgi:outer membrane lipoprotein-sorting protein
MHRRDLLAALAVLLAAPALAAERAPPPPLSDEDRATVEKAADYLDGLGQLKGRFVQTDPRGSMSQGTLYLNRPGKARFEYEGPAQRLVVSDGRSVVVYDGRLKTRNRYPLGSTPLALFLQRHVRLDQKVVVDRVDHLPGQFIIVAHDGRHESQGHVVLTFSESPVELREWSIVDARGGKTSVRLSELEPVSGLDPGLFQVQEPVRPARGM